MLIKQKAHAVHQQRSQQAIPQMKQTGHKSLPVLRGYIREGSLFTENATAKVGL